MAPMTRIPSPTLAKLEDLRERDARIGKQIQKSNGLVTKRSFKRLLHLAATANAWHLGKGSEEVNRQNTVVTTRAKLAMTLSVVNSADVPAIFRFTVVQRHLLGTTREYYIAALEDDTVNDVAKVYFTTYYAVPWDPRSRLRLLLSGDGEELSLDTRMKDLDVGEKIYWRVGEAGKKSICEVKADWTIRRLG
ncbi:hypothetical protein K504DRAFT_506680 [Pleomassaria siparia CBS 279.74]|uniref:Uncharacterized protein n=1 Tax=Pleomassaria siparia CBS 279.74 TaxID=1314801 RepID=A0A6G1JVR9_9PLEO|nr:hypothetical protein K504DRAFT_506680 [Pleomassaria siparia CBS 279.74]